MQWILGRQNASKPEIKEHQASAASQQLGALQEEAHSRAQRVKELEAHLQQREAQLEGVRAGLQQQSALMDVCAELAHTLQSAGNSVIQATASLQNTPSAPSLESPACDGGAGAILHAHQLAGVISAQEHQLAERLVSLGQAHLFDHWPAPGTLDDKKREQMDQVSALELSCVGGLSGYIANARRLLRDAHLGVNPLEGWTPTVPSGVHLEYGSPAFLQSEQEGARAAGRAAFVLVAGGLGERLGFSGIKIALPSEKSSMRCFLAVYIESILSLQKLAKAQTGEDRQLPLAIMTSDDTHQQTQELLAANKNFGMKAAQITLLKQEKVPCLKDNDASLALGSGEEAFRLLTKPHGHGDVHTLLHASGTLQRWGRAGVQWVCFFQDTNALVFRGLVAALGVSAQEGLDVNSLAVPRKAKEAIGGIARLENAAGESVTLNVEYNQLDPLLRATGHPDGDANLPSTGHSPFPGNINQLVFALGPYQEQLERTGGAIAEFVNPKYKNSDRSEFKAPTRLECMMQDYPKNIPKESRVGFTTLEVWAAYSPVKNSPEEARAKAAAGAPTHSAASGEMDVYAANARVLAMLGAQVDPPARVVYNGVELNKYPAIVWSPAFAVTYGQLASKFPCSGAGGVRISQRSALVINGPDIHISSLVLDGALVIRAVPGAKVRVESMSVENRGWEWIPVNDSDASVLEVDRIRGFTILRHETRELEFKSPGVYIVNDP